MLNDEAELKTEMVTLVHKAYQIDDQEDDHYDKGKRDAEQIPDLQRQHDRIYVHRKA